jgi:acetylornithine deacetylase/succinyl-diaminopimelate desuccinylase-like protein
MKSLLALFLSSCALSAGAADVPAWRHAHEAALLRDFTQLLSFPNIAANKADMRRNADFISEMLRARGITPRLLETPDAPPVVYAEWIVPHAKRTILLYAHYDGQPVNPAAWTDPPFAPVLRRGPKGPVVAPDSADAVLPDNRLYARGAGDDKGGVMAILSALQAIRELKLTPSDSLKIVFEGEEEAGSPHLEAILRSHRDLLKSDLWVVCDGPIHPSGRNLIVYGVRGDMNVDLTVFGPIRGLHSGHYGNWTPNPGLELARLLASMKDETGHVVVKGWYDDILPMGAREKAAMDATLAFDDDTRRALGFAKTEMTLGLAESATVGSLNINGMASGDVGAMAANVIPDHAAAVLDIRLVAGETPARQFAKLQEHLRSQGFLVLDRAPTAAERESSPKIAMITLRPGAYGAARTPMDHPLAAALSRAARAASPNGLVELPTDGGSLPLSVVVDALGAPAIILPIANGDDNQHAADENLRLGNLWAGIDLLAATLLHDQ